jgi:hypothetical protein
LKRPKSWKLSGRTERTQLPTADTTPVSAMGAWLTINLIGFSLG